MSFQLSRDAFGHLRLRDEQGQVFEQVVPVRAFPISAAQDGISIMDREGHELVWLNHLAETTIDNQALIQEELASREFVPLIEKIVSVSTFATPSSWQIKTNRGDTVLILKGEDDIRRISKTTCLISDTNGVQYLIDDIGRLDKQSRRLLDRFL
ncbi:MAG: DUF1854 domain-containing protein [Burkholderiaceae bacterium]|jgi:hypothetical protein|uniref:cyanophycin metabolism-associated DUF1854 family protein n=1 Tax=Polynucleobacter sp. MWH-Loch1C5 TaxID=2689108 RepID=UPI001C0B1414|nr:DUF1854 domain-containing protein [Polynucleobacter sp. MWH-Loch1C5]MBU3542063.1 DUF1854 domain-containing protein [Polynucleobacter sp. MWH-Loch1C5]NBV01445.1 DUF1854 domain-containing protein [Burkholderiaceae bacterium]